MLYRGPHAEDVWVSSEDLQLDAGSVCSLGQASSRASVIHEHCPNLTVLLSTAGCPLRFSQKKKTHGLGFDKEVFSLLPFFHLVASHSKPVG